MSINPKFFFKLLLEHNIDFFAGVPDSLLKEICLCIDDKVHPLIFQHLPGSDRWLLSHNQ